MKSLPWFAGAYFCLLVGGGQIFIFQKGVMGFFLDLGLKIYGAPFYLRGDGFLINLFGLGYCGFFTKESGLLCWIAFILFIVGCVSLVKLIIEKIS